MKPKNYRPYSTEEMLYTPEFDNAIPNLLQKLDIKVQELDVRLRSLENLFLRIQKKYPAYWDEIKDYNSITLTMEDRTKQIIPQTGFVGDMPIPQTLDPNQPFTPEEQREYREEMIKRCKAWTNNQE